MERIFSLDTLRMTDVARVGGKNASLGEMFGALSAAGVRVPGGFATTASETRRKQLHDFNIFFRRLSSAGTALGT